MPLRHLRGREAHDVGDEAHRGPRRVEVLLLRLVLLEDVVLDRAARSRARHAGAVADGDVHRHDHRRRPVDRHRRRHRAEIDAGEQVFHVEQRADGDAGLADFADRPAGRRSRDPSAWGDRTRSTGRSAPASSRARKRSFVSAAVPKPANIRIVQSFERYIDAYGPRVYGNWPGERRVAVDGLHRDARHRLVGDVADLGAFVLVTPGAARVIHVPEYGTWPAMPCSLAQRSVAGTTASISVIWFSCTRKRSPRRFALLGASAAAPGSRPRSTSIV